jgi:hypothetical protein
VTHSTWFARNIIAIVIAIPAVVILFEALILFYVRKRQLCSRYPSLAEISLFIWSAAAISSVVSIGYLLQYYFVSVLYWQGANIHDVLTRSQNKTLPLLIYFLSSIPASSISGATSVLILHFRRQAANFYITGIICFFLLLSSVDIIVTLIKQSNPDEAPLWASLIADFLGAPILAGITTSFYFGSALVNRAASGQWVRTVVAVGVVSLIFVVIVGVLFFVQKIFLTPAPTYIDAEIRPTGQPGATQSLVTYTRSPSLDFFGQARSVAGEGEMMPHNNFSLSWNAHGEARADMAVFLLSGCDSKAIVDQNKKILGRQISRFSKSLSLTARFPSGFRFFQFFSSERHPALLSIRRAVPNGFQFNGYTVHNRDGSTDAVTIVSAGDTILLTPAAGAIALSFSTILKHSPGVLLNLQVNGSTYAINVGDARDDRTSERCMATKLGFGGKQDKDRGRGVDAVVVRISSPPTFGKGAAQAVPPIRISPASGILNVSDVLDVRQRNAAQTVLQGQTDLLAFSGRISRFKAYGEVQSNSYTGSGAFLGTALNASLSGDMSMRVNGLTSTFYTAPSDRMMKTPWELMSDGMQVFVLTLVVSILGGLASWFALSLSQVGSVSWLDW